MAVLDVKVTIDLIRSIGKTGFGIPLIMSKEESEIAYTECASLPDVVAAGYAEESNTYKAATLLFMQNNAPAKIAVYGTAAATLTAGLDAVINKSWRQLIVTDLAEELLSTVSNYIETTEDKMYFTSVSSTAALATLSSNDRTIALYYTGSEVCPEAALVGASAGLDVGSFTYKNMILKGLTPELDSKVTEAEAVNAITFVTKAGDNVTSEGKSLSGEYIDIVDSKDYVINQLTYQTQRLLNQSKKIPYDNNGIALLEAVAINVMKDCYNKGIIGTEEDGSPAYTVNYLLREQTNESDRADRKYIGGQFSFKLAGAVHECEIHGEIII